MTRQKIASIIFFIMPFAFAWVLIGQIIQSQLTTDKLLRITGIVDTTIEVATYRHKSNRKDHELRIFLRDTSEYFRFMDIYNYDRFRNRIKQGDAAEIYIRPKWLVPLGLGYRNDIFQMSINGQIIFDISQTHRNSNGIIIVSIIAIPLFIFLGQWTRRKARQKKSSRQHEVWQKTG